MNITLIHTCKIKEIEVSTLRDSTELHMYELKFKTDGDMIPPAIVLISFDKNGKRIVQTGKADYSDVINRMTDDEIVNKEFSRFINSEITARITNLDPPIYKIIKIKFKK